MRDMSSIFSIATALVALLFSTAYSEEVSLIGKYKAEVETLHGITVSSKIISIDVLSTGCTKEDDFKWVIRTKSEREKTLVTVIRIQPDPCDAIEHNVTLTFSRKEIGLHNVETFRVVNAVRGFPRFSF